MMAILFPLSAFCAGGDEFTTEVCGTEMTFVVLNETDKTCGVGKAFIDADNTCIGRSYAGDIIIPSEVNGYTVLEIVFYAFNDCEGVTSVSIPNTVKTIRPYAFSGCSGMTSISIPSSVKNIEEGAFSGCTSLTSVNITDIEAWCNIQFSDWDGGVQRISNPLFCAQHLYLNGEEVHELSIPNTVTSIGANAFLGCTGITSVDIPSSVTSIGKGAFSSTGLTSVTLPSHITSYNGAFASCNSLTSVEISDGITLIDEGAFNGCAKLNSVAIPNSVTSIGRIAFAYSGLTSISLPSSITSIEEGAFAMCSNLSSVISEIQEPFVFENGAFYSISDACVLYVPKGTRDAYIAAGWTEEVFKGGIVELEEGEEVWSAEFPETASSIIPADVSRNAWGTGIYTYTQYYGPGTSECYVLRRYSLTNPNRVQFCLYGWIDYTVNLIIDADYSKRDPATGYVPLSVAPQFIGEHSSVYDEDVMVADSYLYTNIIRGEECSPEDYPSYFDELNGRFVLNLAYYISRGYFGRGEETFQLDGYEPIVEFIDSQEEDGGTFTWKYGILTGEHVKEVKYAIVKGLIKPDSQEAADIYDKILRNDVDDFITYGEITSKVAQQVNMNIPIGDGCSFFYTYSNDGITSHFKSVGSFGGVSYNWVDRYIGTYTYKYLYCDYENPDDIDTWLPVEQEGMILQQSTEYPSYWRIKNWGNGIFFEFKQNDDGTLTVYRMPIDNIGDVASRPNGYSFVASRNNSNSVYDEAAGTYTFDLFYGLKEIGNSTLYQYTVTSYARGYETFVITDLVPLEEDETVDIAEEITEETNIDGNVIGNIFYNINPENGGYVDGCIVVSKPTEEASVEMEEGTDIFGEDFKAGFTGIVFKVPAGSGTIKITAETTGNTTLKVKIGNNAPIEMELEGKLKASFPYNVSKDTYVYIYAGQTSASNKRRAPGDSQLKIYSVELKRDQIPTDIDEVQGTKDNVQGNDAIYNMGGQRLSTPQKGLNIIRTEDGKTRKVFIK